MLDDVDDQTDWITNLTRDYRHSFGAGRLPRESDLEHLSDLVHDLVAAHEVMADLYRGHRAAIDKMLEKKGKHHEQS
ncbi:hypothetical protein [Amycolatopsis sp. NPDC004378]